MQFENPYGPATANMYAMCAMRHMYQYGTTSEQLAWIKVAASHHAQHNPHAMLRDVVTVEDVVNSPMIADPLHRLDCCVISDGGGAIIVASPEVARSLKRPKVKIIGAGEAPKHQMGGHVDLTYSGAVWSGPAAFAEAGVKPADIKYASIYDSFTITVLMQIEDLGFCEKGQGGRFVSDGNLISGTGKLPFNTDGGGLVQQPPGQPRRSDQGGRGGAPVARRGASRRAGQELRSGDCARHRRLARHTARCCNRDHGKGVRQMQSQERKIQAPQPNPETKAFWEAAAAGRLMIGKCTACGQVHYYPRAICPYLLQRQDRIAAGLGQRDDLHLQRHAPRADPLRDRLCDIAAKASR